MDAGTSVSIKLQYLDSLGGWWLYRWGNNPVRTYQAALFLEDREIAFLNIPYAHQDFCTCGNTGLQCRPDRQAEKDELIFIWFPWKCVAVGESQGDNKSYSVVDIFNLITPPSGSR